MTRAAVGRERGEVEVAGGGGGGGCGCGSARHLVHHERRLHFGSAIALGRVAVVRAEARAVELDVPRAVRAGARAARQLADRRELARLRVECVQPNLVEAEVGDARDAAVGRVDDDRVGVRLRLAVGEVVGEAAGVHLRRRLQVHLLGDHAVGLHRAHAERRVPVVDEEHVLEVRGEVEEARRQPVRRLAAERREAAGRVGREADDLAVLVDRLGERVDDALRVEAEERRVEHAVDRRVAVQRARALVEVDRVERVVARRSARRVRQVVEFRVAADPEGRALLRRDRGVLGDRVGGRGVARKWRHINELRRCAS